MTYIIMFVNFMLGAPSQKNLDRWWGVRVLPALYGSYAHVGMRPNNISNVSIIYKVPQSPEVLFWHWLTRVVLEKGP